MSTRAWWIVGAVLALLWINRRPLVSASIDALAEAIGYVESRGNYRAVGPLTATGQRAYGKYQVLGSNVGPWTQRALGRALTVDAFLQNPTAQDVTVRDTLGRLLATYGNPADVASVWFSGHPLAVAGQAADVTGVTTPQYVQAVLARL